MSPTLEHAITLFQPELRDQVNRFDFPSSKNEWNKWIEKINNFVLNRPCEIQDQVFELIWL